MTAGADRIALKGRKQRREFYGTAEACPFKT